MLQNFCGEPYLIPLPARAFDPSPIVYRVVDAEGLVAWRGNRYSVPWRYIGQTLPVRITETELVIYSPQVEEVARHRKFDDNQTGQQAIQEEHWPRRDGAERLEMLREGYARLGEAAVRFLEGLLSSRRYGKDEAQKVLALLGTYAQADLLRALARAAHYGAFSLRAVERILAATARPKGLFETLADEARPRLEQLHPDPPVPPRPTAEYQFLLEGPPDEKQPLSEEKAEAEDEDEPKQGGPSEGDSADEGLD